MIDALRREQGFATAPMCRVLNVSKSGYSAWKNRRPSARKLEEGRIKIAIRAAHQQGRGTYGPEKIQDELSEVELRTLTGIGSRDDFIFHDTVHFTSPFPDYFQKNPRRQVKFVDLLPPDACN